MRWGLFLSQSYSDLIVNYLSLLCPSLVYNHPGPRTAAGHRSLSSGPGFRSENTLITKTQSMNVRELSANYGKPTSNAQKLAIIAGKHVAAMNEPTETLKAYSVTQWETTGLSHAAAVRVHAALSLDLRKIKKEQITQSGDAYRALLEHFPPGLHYEKFMVVCMNRRNEIVGIETCSTGGIAGTVVDAKIVFSHALKYHASSIILAHNHPSGNQNPSTADKALTTKLVKAGNHLDIGVLDHLIITDDGFLSLADEGYI